MSYGMHVTLDKGYEEAIEAVTAALKSQGFGILTEIDMKATMKKKLDVDIDRYVILGACNPKIAYRAMQTEEQVGLLLPCNVIVYERAGQTHVSFLDPDGMMQMAGNADLEPIAAEARQLLETALEQLRN